VAGYGPYGWCSPPLGVLWEKSIHPSEFYGKRFCHGVIVFDEASGEIQRVTREAEMGPDDPVSSADVLVEYGSVEIDGKYYRCPVRSVAVTRVQIIPANHSVIFRRTIT
jgi:hypothetical protein